ncbi:MAG: MFS transporter [Nitrososphaerota archaeon]|nr:MFS transporter [Nitrososphaerota archaeon]
MVESVNINESNKRYRRNLLLFLIDWSAYGTAMNFVSLTTVLPAFVSSLTNSRIAVGLVSTISVLGWNFFQLVSAGSIENRRYKKPFILRITPGERIPWLIIGISTLLFATNNPILTLLIFYVSYIIISVSSGLCTTAWLDIIAKSIPEGKRGFFFSAANMIGAVLGLLSGLVVAFYMDFFDYPLNYFMCFLTAFIFISISWIDINFIDEPPSNTLESPNGIKDYVRKLPRIIKSDKNYFLYTISGIVGAFGGIASSFYTAYAIDRFNAGDFEVGLFTTVFVGSQIIASILWRIVQEKYDHRKVLITGGIIGIIGIILSITAKSINHFLIVFAFTGVSFSSFMVSNFPLLMQMSPDNERPTYIGLSSALKSPFLAIAPIIGGLIIEKYGYIPAFMISLFFAIASTLILTKVRTQPIRVEMPLQERLIKRF